MTKHELCILAAEKAGMKAYDAVKLTNFLIEEIKDAVQKGDTVTLRGLGTFRTKIRKARKAQNIRERKTIHLPETTVIDFVVSDEWKREHKLD